MDSTTDNPRAPLGSAAAAPPGEGEEHVLDEATARDGSSSTPTTPESEAARCARLQAELSATRVALDSARADWAELANRDSEHAWTQGSLAAELAARDSVHAAALAARDREHADELAAVEVRVLRARLADVEADAAEVRRANADLQVQLAARTAEAVAAAARRPGGHADATAVLQAFKDAKSRYASGELVAFQRLVATVTGPVSGNTLQQDAVLVIRHGLNTADRDALSRRLAEDAAFQADLEQRGVAAVFDALLALHPELGVAVRDATEYCRLSDKSAHPKRAVELEVAILTEALAADAVITHARTRARVEVREALQDVAGVNGAVLNIIVRACEDAGCLGVSDELRMATLLTAVPAAAAATALEKSATLGDPRLATVVGLLRAGQAASQAAAKLC